jgi:hypothetical protein
MSRGLGLLQRRVCEALEEAEGHELPLRELRRRLGDTDRSNLRRAIRGLLKRGIVEEPPSEGEPSVALTDWGYVSAGARPEVILRPGEAVRVWKGSTDEGTHWFGYERRPVRNRPLGESQKLVLVALRENADPLEEGLPLAALKAAVGGDRANTRRATRSLLLRGLFEESGDGGRVRLSLPDAFGASSLP